MPEVVPEKPASSMAKNKCEICENNCQLKCIRGHCKGHKKKEKK